MVHYFGFHDLMHIVQSVPLLWVVDNGPLGQLLQTKFIRPLVMSFNSINDDDEMQVGNRFAQFMS